MLLGSGLGAVALIAFLIFAVTGLIWLVITLQQADPAITRKNTALIALVSGAVLIAVLLAQALFLPRATPGQRIAQRIHQNAPGLLRPAFGGQGFPGGRFAPQPPTAPGAPRVRPPLRPNPPAQPAPPTVRPSGAP
ncbi:MAG: hypothetical protein EXR61_05065 [Chloroflexi bacterium]|nr:hypothetical protein [Chloroflexota bacterium]